MGFMDDYEDNIRRFRKRQTLSQNKFNGRLAETNFEFQQRMMGNDVRRDPYGRDFIVTHRDPITRRYIKTTHDEVKSSQTAPLSPFQEAEKKRIGSRYRVHRPGL